MVVEGGGSCWVVTFSLTLKKMQKSFHFIISNLKAVLKANSFGSNCVLKKGALKNEKFWNIFREAATMKLFLVKL